MVIMLIQFSVENFKSIKERVYLTLMANNDTEHLEYTAEKGKGRVLKTAVVYGANASGKSNIFAAMTTAILLVRRSNQSQITEKMNNIVPYVFDEKWRTKPSSFDFIFEVNGTKYNYGFSADRDRVYSEYLYAYYTSKPSKIFERRNCNDYSFTDKEKKTLNDFVEKNADNKLFLATATAWNYEKTKEPFRWFAELIDTYDNYEALKQKSFDAYDTDENGSLKKFTTQLLMNADFNISNYDFESKTLSGAEVLEILPEKFRMDFSELIEGKQFDLSMIHRFYENDGNTKEMPLNFDFESKGTKNLFYFAPVLMNSFNRGKTIIIDEIDNGLHPLLVEYILHLFYNSEFNKADAQLIFNTHDVNLLNLDNFRRDQIYFSEKKPENGATDLYSLDEFSPRKNENVQKGYLQGRYGAVPMISERDNLWKN